MRFLGRKRPDNTVPALIVEGEELGGVIALPREDLPAGAFSMPYGKQRVYPLERVTDEGQERSLRPWKLFDPAHDGDEPSPGRLHLALHCFKIVVPMYFKVDQGWLRKTNFFLVIAIIVLLVFFIFLMSSS